MVDPAPWRWFFNHVDPLPRNLTFTRHVSVDALLEGFGMSRLSTQRMTWTEASERFPVQVQFNQPPFYVRVAEVGEWVVAFEYGQILELIDRYPKLPPGTDTFSVRWTITTGAFFAATFSGQRSVFDPWTTPSDEDEPGLLDRLAAPWVQIRESGGDVYQATLLAAFAEEFDIPLIAAATISEPMVTAWRAE